MVAPPGREAYDGFSQLAHAIRRSTALYVAAEYVCSPDSTIDELEAVADRLAHWIGGNAAQADPYAGPPMGKQWPPDD